MSRSDKTAEFHTNMDLQGLFIQPRASKDPRIAKTDLTKLSESDDGFLYKLLDVRDQGKYRILSEREQFEELSKSREIKEAMMTMSGKLKDGQYVKESPGKAGLRFVPPQFGTTGHKNKIDKRAWEADMTASLGHGGSGSQHLKTKSAKYQNTILELAKNTQLDPIEVDDEEEDHREGHYRRQHPTAEELAAQSPNSSRLQFDVMNTMKNKYEQNLHVVEKLYNEKRAMEQHIAELRNELRHSRDTGRGGAGRWTASERSAKHYHEDDEAYSQDHMPSYGEFSEVERHKQRMAATYAGAAAPPSSMYDHRPASKASTAAPARAKQSAYEPVMHAGDESLPNQGGSRRGTGHSLGYSAEEVAKEMHGKSARDSYYTGSVRDSNSRGAAAAPVRSQSAPRGGRTAASSAGGGASHRYSVDDDGYDNVRSSGGARKFGISSQLQADADRYVQRRRALEERERAAKLAEAQYQQERKEKTMRASLTGKLFTEMADRERQAEEKKLYKKSLAEEKEADARKEAALVRAKAAAKKQQLMDTAIKGTPSWGELEKTMQDQRRERVEQNKQRSQLLSASAAGGSGLLSASREGSGGSRRNSAAAAAVTEAAHSRPRVKGPEEIARQASEQAKAFAALEAAKKERETERRLALEASKVAPRPKTEMELRQEKYDQKARERDAEKKAREAEKKAAADRAEREKHDRLLNLKVPAGKPTKGQELKAEKIKMDLERQREEERKHAALMRKKALREKETQAVVRTLVKEREEARRGSAGGYQEVSLTQEAAAAKAAEARRQYREAYQANQRKIQDSLKNRQSLLERHDTKITNKNATKEANDKVADIFKSSGIEGLDDF